MATDINAIIRNLDAFYNFSNKSVIHIGAGGGQLIGYAAETRSVLAVDTDADALDKLKLAIEKAKMSERFQIFEGDFHEVSVSADVAFFEFCLHEMNQPAEALAKAQTLAPEILIIDHLPESPWSWYADETQKLEKSWAAVEACDVSRRQEYLAIQYFGNYSELFEKVHILGETVINRIDEFKDRKNIQIEMPYGMALISSR
ncbi:class I SAM-dependent methyltransferase [candidate division KSB1 bacterium]|nr:class I SAM-dependent methyltransferase [candidate division KSB1 bacterium]